jgi:hypothetical protein
MNDKVLLKWKVHTPNLLKETLTNPGTSALSTPFSIFGKLLAAVAERAIELKDPELDKLMLRLTLYSQADPESPDYDKELVTRLLHGEI